MNSLVVGRWGIRCSGVRRCGLQEACMRTLKRQTNQKIRKEGEGNQEKYRCAVNHRLRGKGDDGGGSWRRHIRGLTIRAYGEQDYNLHDET